MRFFKSRTIALSLSLFFLHSSTVPATPIYVPWWNLEYNYRVSIAVHQGRQLLINRPIDIEIPIPSNVADGFESYRLIKTKNHGNSVEDNFVPCQVEYDETQRILHLTFLLEHEEPSDASPDFYLYLSREKVDNEPAMPPLVTVDDNVMHEDQESYKITTPTAVYYYHKQGAGFASLEDPDGNDWLGYHTGGGPGGEYRGIPNTGYPEGYNHPGKTLSESRLTSRGPLKVSIESESTDKQWACCWDIYPAFARMTLLKASHPYWILYEGTPGGTLDEETDYVVRPGENGGIKTLCAETWDGDIAAPGEPGEWVYFGDGKRHLYLINHKDDQFTDSYWPMEKQMTVFGFGRLDLKQYMETVPAQFTVGLSSEQRYEEMGKVIRSAYWPVEVRVWGIENHR